MEYPWVCQQCGFLNMVDMENSIELRSIDKISGKIGYVCENCHQFQTIRLTTNNLERALGKMETVKPTHSKFRFFFQKTLRKALEVQGKYGTR